MSYFGCEGTGSGHVTGMLYGRVGERIVGAVGIRLPAGPIWDALNLASGSLNIKFSNDCVPDAKVFLLDKPDMSDITNSSRILSFSGTPASPGRLRVDVFVGDLQVPMSFEVHVREEA